jgi:hypothetical protein
MQFMYFCEGAGIAQHSDRIRAGLSKNRGLISGSGRICSLLHNVQTECGAHPTSYQWVPGVVSPWIKRESRESVCSSPSVVEVKNGETVAALPHTSS